MQTTRGLTWRVAGAVAAIMVAGFVGGATADAASCPTRTTKQAFAAWGDLNSYFVADSGTFESGTGAWSLSGGPTVVSQQSPWKVNGSAHTKALSIPKNAKATTPLMCVAANEEWMRFFYKSPGVAGSAIQVKIEVSNSLGTSINTWAVDGTRAGWFVSPQIYLPNLRDASGIQYLTISFYPINTQANWVIDDVMIDPWIGR